MLPTTPKPKSPPPRDEQEIEQSDLIRKRNNRNRREYVKPNPEKEAKEEKISRQEEAYAPRDRWMMMELSLIAPTMRVQGQREKYTSELTTHFQVFFRKGGKESDNKKGLWYGARLAPFSGTGIYQDVPGNYGFIYFGPILGYGLLEGLPERKKILQETKSSEISLPVLKGWIFSGGLAIQSRMGTTDPADEVDDEFDTKPIAFDSPGLWFEYRLLRVYYGALGMNYVFGLQQGKEKTFVWLGLGMAGWD